MANRIERRSPGPRVARDGDRGGGATGGCAGCGHWFERARPRELLPDGREPPDVEPGPGGDREAGVGSCRERERSAQPGRRGRAGSHHHAVGGVRGDRLVPPARRDHAVAVRGLLPCKQQSDRSWLGGAVLDPPIEGADRQRTGHEIAPDHRAELLADDANAELARLEGLPGPWKQRVVRALAGREGVDRWRQIGRPERRQQGGSSRLPIGRPDMDRESVDRRRREPVASRPRDASAPRRRGTSARCSPSRVRRSARRPTRRRRPSGSTRAGVRRSRQGSPIPRCQATSGIRGASGPPPCRGSAASLGSADSVGTVTSRRR